MSFVFLRGVPRSHLHGLFVVCSIDSVRYRISSELIHGDRSRASPSLHFAQRFAKKQFACHRKTYRQGLELKRKNKKDGGEIVSPAKRYAVTSRDISGRGGTRRVREAHKKEPA
jgi:hypothetical protein